MDINKLAADIVGAATGREPQKRKKAEESCRSCLWGERAASAR